ncbi:MAG: hypothetical protein JW682_07645 [Campylobacterales bacterium]|nr:hypothetical protein [Campylobacterales bacterium]HEO97891.1 hypothetical protein [Campylobacterota bacterium]
MIKNLHCINDEESFKAFAAALFSKLDEINTVVVEQNKMLQEHGDKLEAQSRQIQKMNEAFDMIMGDYFKEIMDGVKDFDRYAKNIMDNSGKELSTAEGQETLLNRLEILKGRAELVEETTVGFSSKQMQEIYRAVVPDIKKEIDELYRKIVKSLHEMHDVNTDNIVNNAGAVIRTITNHNDNMNAQIRSLATRISESETAIKRAMPGNSGNSYRN